MRVLDRGKLRHQRKKRVQLALANDRTMRDYAAMARTQLRTKDYSVAARKRLGEEVERARRALGYRYRTDFCRAYGIKNLRGVELLEQGQPGVGQAFLFEVARALPGWDESTPRHVLEGGSPPEPTPVKQPPEPAVPQGEFERLEDDLVARLLRQGFSPERIDRALDAFREAHLGLSTVESAVDEPAVPDRARSAGFVDRPSDTGTG